MGIMGQGRGSAGVFVCVLVFLSSCGLLASAATLTVGGSQGWTIGGPNYTTWAANLTFTTADVLLFRYTASQHDVVEVNKADYDACTDTNAISTFTGGNTTVPLNTTGAHYFLCSFTGHCTAGMKLAITVVAGVAPAPAPSRSVGTPAPTPKSAPTSTPTPSSTPPSAPAPPATTPGPSPVNVGTPLSPTSSTPSASAGTPPPPSTPSPAGAAAPPSSAPFLPSTAPMAAALLCLSAALFAF